MERLLFLNASQFLLILTRMLVMLLVAPIFSGKMVPIRFRVILAFLLAFLLALHQDQTVLCFQNSFSWADAGFLKALLGEFFLGLVFGTAGLFLLGALQTAGTAAAYAGGISFPMDGGLSNDAAPITASFFYLLGTALLFLCGGHLMMLESLLRSFAAYPSGAVPALPELAKQLPDLFILGFQLGVHMALPILTVLLLAQIGLAVLNRVLPQLDVFGMAFPMNVLVLLFVLSLTLGAAMTLFLNGFTSGWSAFFVFSR